MRQDHAHFLWRESDRQRTGGRLPVSQLFDIDMTNRLSTHGFGRGTALSAVMRSRKIGNRYQLEPTNGQALFTTLCCLGLGQLAGRVEHVTCRRKQLSMMDCARQTLQLGTTNGTMPWHCRRDEVVEGGA